MITRSDPAFALEAMLGEAVTGFDADRAVCEYDDGTPIPPASVLRLICTGVIVPIIVGADGNVLDVGRQQRIANRAQRRALRAMYRTCAFHGCDITFNRCEIHHIRPWELDGLTDLINLLPLCSRHHHLVHEAGWSLELAHDRTLTITEPDGQVYATVPIQIRSTTPTTARHGHRHHRRRIEHQTSNALAN